MSGVPALLYWQAIESRNAFAGEAEIVNDTVVVTRRFPGFVGAAVARAALARGLRTKVLMRPTASRAM